MDNTEWKNFLELVEKLKKDMGKQSAPHILDAAADFLKHEDYEKMYHFFSGVYDEIYHDMIFKKMEVNNATRSLLETLSMPLYKLNKQEQDKWLNDINTKRDI